MRVDEILQKLDQVRKTGAGWTARCPAHEDRKASLSIAIGSEDRILVKCFSGCRTPDILRALGLREADLFAEKAPGAKRPARAAASWGSEAKVCGRPTYIYRQADGEPSYGVNRAPGKRFSQCHYTGKEWRVGRAGRPSLPYQLRELTEARQRDPEALIVVVEGEKDTLRLWQTGLPATTLAGGATSIARDAGALVEPLKGANVVLVPDHDDPGREAMGAVARTLAPTAKSIRWLELPGLQEKGDTSDWLDAGGAVEQLRALASEAPEWREPEAQPQPLDGALAGGPGEDGDDGEPPIPLGDRGGPELDIDGWPAWLRDYVRALSVAVQFPESGCAGFALGAISTCHGGFYEVVASGSWREPVNLYLAIGAESGSRKTSVESAVFAPIREWERYQAEQMRVPILEARTQRKILEDRLERLRKRASRIEDPEARHVAIDEARIAALEVEAEVVPVPPRLIIDDATSEAVAEQLAAHGGRIALISSEGDVFSMVNGLYVRQGLPNMGPWLRGHSGESLRIDRRSRESIFIESASLTICCGFQPDSLADIRQADELKRRGLFGRFVFVLPERTVGTREINPPPISASIEETYRERLMRILDNRPVERRELSLTPGARQLFDEFQASNERELNQDGKLATLVSWGSKRTGLVLRISALLHLANVEPGAEPGDVAECAMRSAIALAEGLVEHDRLAMAALGADPAVIDGQWLLDWIERRQNFAPFSERDALRAGGARWRKQAKRVQAALQLLDDHGWVFPMEPPKQDGPGRPPSPKWGLTRGAIDALLGQCAARAYVMARQAEPEAQAAPSQAEAVQGAPAGDDDDDLWRRAAALEDGDEGLVF